MLLGDRIGRNGYFRAGEEMLKRALKPAPTYLDARMALANLLFASAPRCSRMTRPELREIERSERELTAAFFAERVGWGNPSPAPIFILGMPRSGSTLVEQILSSHPLIEGTAELPAIPILIQTMAGDHRLGRGDSWRELLPKVPREELTALGGEYLDPVAALRKTDRPWFIDKLPQNWADIAFIHLALPGRIHRIIYEELVDALEGETRRLLAHIGADFDPACVDFHRTERAVATASSKQVRRPLNREGIGAWRKYEPWLGPLVEALGDLPPTYRA